MLGFTINHQRRGRLLYQECLQQSWLFLARRTNLWPVWNSVFTEWSSSSSSGAVLTLFMCNKKWCFWLDDNGHIHTRTDGKRSRYRETCSGLGLGQRSLTQTQTQAQEGNTKMIIIFIDIPSSKSYTKFILKHFVCCVFHRQQTSLSRGFLPLSWLCTLVDVFLLYFLV